MLHRIVTRAALAAMLLSPAVALGQASQALAERLYRESGMAVQFAALPSQFAAGVTQSQDQWDRDGDLPPGFTDELGKGVERSFDLAAFEATIVGKLSESLSPEQISEVLVWVSSEQGQRMTALEKAAASMTPRDYAAYARSLATAPPETAYVERVQQLMKAVKAVDSSVEVALMMQLGVVAAAVGATPDAPPDALATAVRQLESMRPRMQQALVDQLLLSFLYTYREASAADLDAYVRFASSPTGEAYHRATFEGMALGLRDVSLRIGKLVAEQVQRMLRQKQI